MSDHLVAEMDLMKIMFQKGTYPAKCPSKDETKEPNIKNISCSGQLFQNFKREESFPVGCVPPAFLIPGGSTYSDPLDRDPSLDRDPWTGRPHKTETPSEGSWNQGHRPPEGKFCTWDKAAKDEVTS